MFRLANMTMLIVFLFVTFGASTIDGNSIGPSKCDNTERCVPMLIAKQMTRTREQIKCTSWCTTSDWTFGYCCSRETMLFDRQNNAKVPDFDKLKGPNDAKINEFLWLAVLEYRNPNFSTPNYRCAGSLISQRYVLTAAHCINDELIHVHLGKYDLNKTEICDARGVCAPTVTADIEETITHSELTNDIGLIRLSIVVNYTIYIQPISLPSTLPSLTALEDGTKWEIAGWGRGSPTSAKQKLTIPIINLADCRESHNNFSGKNVTHLNENYVCAGGDTDVGACVGDSGGSLSAVVYHEDKPKPAIVGILSSGYDFCGNQNKNRYPMLFTRVANFEPWIRQNMRP